MKLFDAQSSMVVLALVFRRCLVQALPSRFFA